jgi:prephenate dehydrogenase
MTPSVGIIGYGRFGRVLTRFLAQGARVFVHDPALAKGEKLPRGARRVGLAEASSQPVVILAVPISALESLLKRIRDSVLPGALVLDVCSVKSMPLAWMKRILPRSVRILGTHPLFGPDSVEDSLKGHHIIVCPGRSGRNDIRLARRVLAAAGLRVDVMTPAAHDRLMAETLLLAQYLGRLPGASGIPLHERATPSYGYVRALATVAMNDTDQLFRDMWRYNPSGSVIARRIGAGHRRLLGRIARRGR